MTHPRKKSWTLGSAAPLFTQTYISLYIFFWESFFFPGKSFPGPRIVPSVKCSELLIVFTGPLSSLCFRQFLLLCLSSLSTPLPFFQSTWSLFPQLPVSLPLCPPLFLFLQASLLFLSAQFINCSYSLGFHLPGGRLCPPTSICSSSLCTGKLSWFLGGLEVTSRMLSDWGVWVSSKFPPLYYLPVAVTLRRQTHLNSLSS